MFAAFHHQEPKHQELHFAMDHDFMEDKEQRTDDELECKVTGDNELKCEEPKKQHGDVVEEKEPRGDTEHHVPEVTKKCIRCCRVHDVKVPCLYNIPCPRCGLIHCEYTVSAWIDGFDFFDCNVYIPNLNEHKMDGNTILLSERVIKFLDDLAKSKHEGAKVDDSDDVLFVADSMAGETKVPNSQTMEDVKLPAKERGEVELPGEERGDVELHFGSKR